MVRFNTFFLFALALIIASASAAFNRYEATYRIGVLAYKGKPDAIKKWAAHADYLNRKLPRFRFEIIPLTYEQNEMTRAVQSRHVDFIITNPGHFTELELAGHVVHLATRRIEGPLGILDQFGGTAITQSNRSDINNYRDLSGKKSLFRQDPV